MNLLKLLEVLQVKSYSLIVSNLLLLLSLGIVPSCSHSESTPPSTQSIDERLSGPISFPFGPTTGIGDRERREPFVIRSNTGAAEYQVELPGSGRDYEVEIPVTLEGSKTSKPTDGSSKLGSAVSTDKELLSELPDMELRQGATAALLDKSMGVGKTDRGQGPSYSLGLAKIRNYYSARQFEFSLIELNNLLAFYPGSPLLYKMKGSILLKLGNRNLASKSWIKAFELAPTDKVLQVALNRLLKSIQSSSVAGPIETPNPNPAPSQNENSISH
jgi:hypothetical protein